MIDVNYNEYKETLAENMKLIRENHDLKERLSIYESDSDTVIMSKEKWEETKKELKIEKDISDGMLKAIDKAIEYMNEVLECNYHGGNVTFDVLVHNIVNILKGNDNNDKRIGN